jgi:hypothetical protein
MYMITKTFFRIYDTIHTTLFVVMYSMVLSLMYMIVSMMYMINSQCIVLCGCILLMYMIMYHIESCYCIHDVSYDVYDGYLNENKKGTGKAKSIRVT